MQRLLHFINTSTRLAFSNHFLEAKYQKEQLKEFLPQNIIVAKIAILLYLTYAPLTYLFITKNELTLLILISIIGIVGALILIRLSSRPIFHKYPALILSSTAFLVGIAPILYYILTTNERALFQVDILLPIIGIFTMYGIGFSLALLSVLSIFIAFLFLSIIIGIEFLDIFAAVYVLISGGLVTGVAAYFIERSHRHLFIIKQESDEFRFMVENAHDSIAIFDPEDMRYLYANQITLNCTRCLSNNIIGKTLSEVHPEFTADMIQTIKRHLDEEKSFSEVYKLYSSHKQAYYHAHIVIQYGYFKGKKVIITFASDVTLQKEAEIQLQNVASKDALTGLYNRYNFDNTAKRLISSAHRYEQSLTLILCDIDHFKKINDRFGHLKGDQILQQIASTITKTVRESDVVARWGGEEFAILLPNTTLPDALNVAEKIRQNVAQLKVEECEQTTVSCGVAVLLEDEDQEKCFQRADTALYEAKSLGRNKVISA